MFISNSNYSLKNSTRYIFSFESNFEKDGKKKYMLRQSIFNNSPDHPDLRTSPYTGFFMMARKHCGLDFFNALSDGSMQMSVYDYDATYDVGKIKIFDQT